MRTSVIRLVRADRLLLLLMAGLVLSFSHPLLWAEEAPPAPSDPLVAKPPPGPAGPFASVPLSRWAKEALRGNHLVLLRAGAERLPPGPLRALGVLLSGDDARAEALLLERIVDAAPTPAEALLIARAGAALQSRNVLQEVRTWSEDPAVASDPLTDLALGLAEYGLAVHDWSRQANTSTIALRFEQAEGRGRSAMSSPDASHAAMGTVLAASVRAIQGDLEVALSLLEPISAPEAGLGGAWAALLRGRLRYDRGAARTLVDGAPDEEARADLQAALADLAFGLNDAFGLLGLPGEVVTDLVARRAWAAHRLGEIETAWPAYAALFDLGTARSRRLALQGLGTLYLREPEAYVGALRSLAARTAPAGLDAAEALIRHLLTTERAEEAIDVALELAEQFPGSASPSRWLGEAYAAAGEHDKARASLVDALRQDPRDESTLRALEALAQSRVEADPSFTLAAYEAALRLRPDDPYLRNNLGFILRELVSPHTTFREGALQTLKEDAPAPVRRWLERCVQVYREAVALIPEAEDGRREEIEDWNLAGIVNDCGLMLHYFTDVQDAAEAEAHYLRAMRMTGDAFKDTYVPNLRRLYGTVLKDRHLKWLDVARRASQAILLEHQGEDSAMVLVADERKRAVAAEDARKLGLLIRKQLDAGVGEVPTATAADPAGAPAGGS